MCHLTRFASGRRRDEHVEPDCVSPLKSNPLAVRRPAGIQVVRRRGEPGDDVEPGTVCWRGHQLDAILRQPEESEPPIRRAHVGAADAIDDAPWQAAKRRNLPDASLQFSRSCGGKIEDRRRVWRPAGIVVIDGVARDLQRRTANELHEELTIAGHIGGECHRLAVRRNGRRFFEPREIREPYRLVNQAPTAQPVAGTCPAPPRANRGLPQSQARAPVRPAKSSAASTAAAVACQAQRSRLRSRSARPRCHEAGAARPSGGNASATAGCWPVSPPGATPTLVRHRRWPPWCR